VSGDLERDLEAWRRGELSLDNLVAAHGSDAEALAALHERLGRTLSAPVDGDAVWATVERGMAAGNVVQLPGRRRRHKVAVLAIAAALAVGGSALAAVGSHIGSHPDRPAGVSGLVTDPSGQPEGPSGPASPTPAATPSKDGDGSPTTTDGDSSGEDSSADNSGSGSTSSDGSGSDSSGDGSSSPSGSGDTGSSDGSGSTGSDGGSSSPSGGDTSPTPSD
jgi:hypothetical protein